MQSVLCAVERRISLCLGNVSLFKQREGSKLAYLVIELVVGDDGCKSIIHVS
jgi:hypothetical protein